MGAWLSLRDLRRGRWRPALFIPPLKGWTYRLTPKTRTREIREKTLEPAQTASYSQDARGESPAGHGKRGNFRKALSLLTGAIHPP